MFMTTLWNQKINNGPCNYILPIFMILMSTVKCQGLFCLYIYVFKFQIVLSVNNFKYLVFELFDYVNFELEKKQVLDSNKIYL